MTTNVQLSPIRQNMLGKPQSEIDAEEKEKEHKTFRNILIIIVFVSIALFIITVAARTIYKLRKK